MQKLNKDLFNFLYGKTIFVVPTHLNLLGVDIKVKTNKSMKENGHYNHKTKTICINPKSDDIARSFIHEAEECRHSILRLNYREHREVVVNALFYQQLFEQIYANQIQKLWKSETKRIRKLEESEQSKIEKLKQEIIKLKLKLKDARATIRTNRKTKG